jgi:ribonuclease Z
MWSELQKGNNVVSAKGETVRPEQVMGPVRRGRKFTYITDTLPVDTLIPEMAESDLLIAEGMFTEEYRETATSKRHMTAVDAAGLAASAGGVKRMGLIHYSPRFTNRQLKQLLTEAESVFPNAFLTRDRMHIPIPYEE